MPRPETVARQVREEHGMLRAPVPVEKLAEKLGARVVFQPFDGGDVSGLLYRDDARVIIGVNDGHPSTRQRFTIAHEIGHLLLHPGKPMILDKVVRVNRRDAVSSLASDKQEIEANGFAASLLMPRELLMQALRRILSKRRGIEEDDLIQELADLFEVSNEAMGHRLTNLGIRPAR